MIRRIMLIAAIICMAGQSVVFAQAVTGNFTGEQYKKALWMVTRFYGAQRMGHGPNWLLMEHKHPVSYVRDSMDGRDLVGGWFDCGDHSKFGQTFFYTTYILAKAYDAFPTGFHDLYHGDYSDYRGTGPAGTGKWTINDGRPNGIPDLLEELKYATDWIIKATPNMNTFYFQKGRGNDHRRWVTSGFQSTLPNDVGGEANGPRDIFKNPADRPMASFAAAALAVMSRVYRKYDKDYADLCLVHARNAYAYAKSQPSGAAVGAVKREDGKGFYGAMNNDKVPMVFHIAAAEMYAATGENTFTGDMRTDHSPWHNWGFNYDNPHDMAQYVSATTSAPTFANNKQAYSDSLRIKFVQRYAGQVNTHGVNTHGDGQWGELRYVANHAFIAALYSKLANTNQYDQFIYDQIDYILGKNTRNLSFLVGFNERAGGIMASKPHHRSVYLNDDLNNGDNFPEAVIKTRNIPERNKFFGYMVGGSRNPDNYQDDMFHFESTEGGLDYQAGLVGALAYIVSKLDPAVPAPLQISTSSSPSDEAAFIRDTLRISENQASPKLYAHLFDENGAVVAGNCNLVSWSSSWVDSDAPITGCEFTVPGDVPPAATITVTLAVAGPERFISKTFAVTVGNVSVLPRASLTKHGCAITVRPGNVVFKAAGDLSVSKVGVYNMQGKKVFGRSGAHKEINWKSGKHPKGMYLVRMTLSNGTVVQRNLMLK